MYQISFYNISEIRMGSPFNIAKIKLTGDFVPNFFAHTFQDLSLITSDGSQCLIIEWYGINSPGFILWKLDEISKIVMKSKKYDGCCKDIKLDNNKILVSIWNFDNKTKTEIVRIEEVTSWFSFKKNQLNLPLGISVLMSSDINEIVSIDGGVVVLVYANQTENIYFVNLDGTIKWRIDSSDRKQLLNAHYTSVALIDNILKGFESGGWDCVIDIETGKILTTEFTK